MPILDGWGLGTDNKVSSNLQTNTPFIDSCYTKFPHAILENWSFPTLGQMGNSEVDHMNLGTGNGLDKDLMQTESGSRKNTLGLEPGIQMAFEPYEIKS